MTMLWINFRNVTNLLVAKPGQAVGAGFPGPTSFAPRWGEAGVEVAVRLEHGIAAVLGR